MNYSQVEQSAQEIFTHEKNEIIEQFMLLHKNLNWYSGGGVS
jgi:hypothetical protein